MGLVTCQQQNYYLDKSGKQREPWQKVSNEYNI